MLSKIVTIGAISLGLTFGFTAVGAADVVVPVPTPNSAGPFTQGTNEQARVCVNGDDQGQDQVQQVALRLPAQQSEVSYRLRLRC